MPVAVPDRAPLDSATDVLIEELRAIIVRMGQEHEGAIGDLQRDRDEWREQAKRLALGAPQAAREQADDVVALAALDRLGGNRKEVAGPRRASLLLGRPSTTGPEGDLAMEHPTYGIDVVALTLAVLLAAAIVLIGSHLMHELADVVPPTLSGAH
jgi:hypothetical protein